MLIEPFLSMRFECPRCHGTGRVRGTVPEAINMRGESGDLCPTCGGDRDEARNVTLSQLRDLLDGKDPFRPED